MIIINNFNRQNAIMNKNIYSSCSLDNGNVFDLAFGSLVLHIGQVGLEPHVFIHSSKHGLQKSWPQTVWTSATPSIHIGHDIKKNIDVVKAQILKL